MRSINFQLSHFVPLSLVREEDLVETAAGKILKGPELVMVRGWDPADGPRPYSREWWERRDIRWLLREIARRRPLT